MFVCKIYCLCAIGYFVLAGPVARSDAHPSGIQPVTGSILRSGYIMWRLVMKCHSVPAAVSSRELVIYWKKNVHQVLINCFGLSLPRKSVDS